MEYLGQTATSSYTQLGRRPESGSYLPAIGMQDIRTGSAPPYSGILSKSVQLPWRPSTYYRTTQVNPTYSLYRSSENSGPLNSGNYLSSIDSIKVPLIFPAARNALYTRYTPKDWYQTQMTNYLTSDKMRSAAEKLRADTQRLAREKEDLSKRNQQESDKRLGERINDIEFWKQELDKEKDKMAKKINQVESKRRDIEKQLHETENQLKVAQENLYEREKRQGIDIVHDNVERELIREIDIIKNSQAKLRNMLERLTTQNSLNRSALHELELDAGDKFRAMSLDSAAHHMSVSSRGLNFHLGIENVDNTVATPESWARFTEDNIKRSAAERIQSDEYINVADNLLKETASDMWIKTLVVEKSRLRQDMDPGELLSVKTFINEQAMEKEAAVKKETPAQSKTEMTEQKGPVKEKKKSRGKKNKQKETAGAHEVAAMGFPPQESSLDFGGLQIISKADWKKLRNTYLNLQRKNMSQAKQKIRQFAAQHPEQFEAEKPKYEAVSEVAAPHIKAEEDVGLAFEPKVVVHFSLEEPIYDVVMLKKKIKAAVMEPVKYIDARPGANSFYVRCGSAEQAKTLSNVKILGDGKVLNDAEEKDYWQKANSDRKEKLEGKVKVKSSRPRGKDKVVKQFKKMEEKQANNHKFFEEED